MPKFNLIRIFIIKISLAEAHNLNIAINNAIFINMFEDFHGKKLRIDSGHRLKLGPKDVVVITVVIRKFWPCGSVEHLANVKYQMVVRCNIVTVGLLLLIIIKSVTFIVTVDDRFH